MDVFGLVLEVSKLVRTESGLAVLAGVAAKGKRQGVREQSVGWDVVLVEDGLQSLLGRIFAPMDDVSLELIVLFLEFETVL